jgi:uncharacterized membrane protein YraQ (UPF0718 family)
MHSPRLLFPVSILVIYLMLLHVAQGKTIVALRSSMDIFFHVLPPLCLVFLLMIGMNIFLKPPHLAKLMGKGTTIQRKLLSAAAGIISAGPIYAWYPMLRDLREKGVEHSLLGIFLVNRGVKPFLLPVMVSFFGWIYVLTLMFLLVVGSFFVGFAVGALLDSPTGSVRKGGS